MEGKGLSTEDYTTAEKSKLARIAENANNYLHPENHPASIITQDADNRFVTDAEKTSWNNKAEKTVATASASSSIWEIELTSKPLILSKRTSLFLQHQEIMAL